MSLGPLQTEKGKDCIIQRRGGRRWRVVSLETEAVVGRSKRGSHWPVASKCSTGKEVRCLLLGTSVVKSKFFCKIGEEHADYRKWE